MWKRAQIWNSYQSNPPTERRWEEFVFFHQIFMFYDKFAAELSGFMVVFLLVLEVHLQVWKDLL